MTIWPVFVEAWQIECCGTPPVVGALLDAKLIWCSTGQFMLPDEALVTRELISRPIPADAGIEGRLLESGRLTAWGRSSPEDGVDAPVTVTGLLIEDHHGMTPEALRRTRGTVRSVQIARQEYERAPRGGSAWLPVGQISLRHVHQSPKWFDQGLPVPDRERTRTAETGVLVQLDVDD